MPPTIQSFVNSFNNKLEEPVRLHLKNVYACLTLSGISASAGAYVNMFTNLIGAGLFPALAAMGLLFTLVSTPYSDKNQKYRLGLLLGFAFFSGVGLGPLLEHAIELDPAIIMTALISTIVVFLSFTLSSIFARRGSWLCLGSSLMTVLSTIMLFSFANIFMGSQILYQANLYLGLALMCGFVLFDTQMIIEKRRNGDKDFVAHSMDLFIDFIGIFRRLVVLLSQKEQSKRNKKQ